MLLFFLKLFNYILSFKGINLSLLFNAPNHFCKRRNRMGRTDT